MHPINPHPLVKASVVYLDPTLARQLYDGNAENQRRVSSSNLRKVEESIKSGLFALNGESIIQSVSGKLLNGQHRVLAVLNTGIGIWTVLVLNVPDEYFHTIDSGKSRSFSDVCQISGDSDARNVSTTILRLAEYYTDSRSVGTMQAIPHARLQQVKEMCGDVTASISAVVASSNVMSRSRTAWLYHVVSTQSKARADEFFGALANGESLSSISPVYHLRERMLREKGAKAKLQNREALALLIKAWNVFIEERPLKTLRWTDGEPFPELRIKKP